MKMTSSIATAAFCCAAALNVIVVQARELAGVNMPPIFGIAGRTLQLNGMGLGTRRFSKST